LEGKENYGKKLPYNKEKPRRRIKMQYRTNPYPTGKKGKKGTCALHISSEGEQILYFQWEWRIGF
jgi:hypothetical protein